jgi:TonB family protein
MMRVKTALLLVGSVVLALGVPVASRASEAPGLNTYFRLLVGRPDAQASGESILVVPGTVIASGRTAEQQASDLLRVIDELKEAYRLSTIEPGASAVVPLQPGESGDAPSVEGGPQVKVKMLALDDQKATYRLTLTEAGKTLAEPTLTVRRGGRAIVGSRDGAAAPYLFLVVEPLPYTPPREAGGGSVSEPKVLQRTAPKYPAEAKKARIEGIVLLEATLGVDGLVKSTKVLRGEPAGLTEAAIEALNQWRYEPARNSAGQPIAVVMTVTFRFRLS